MTYFLILGKNPKLSIAEIKSVIKNGKFVIDKDILFLETNEKIDVEKLIKRLGGTIKIGEVVGKIKKLDELVKLCSRERKFSFPTDGKIYFGISNYANYSTRDIKRVAMEIKKEFKKISPVRWVTSREKILSSVIVKTNNLLDKGMEICLFDNGKIGKTLEVQEFKELGKREFKKPERDILRGMLPAKLAKIMINLSEAKLNDVLLDPFCGTGTILMEETAMSYKNLIGSDTDKDAIYQTEKNLDWLDPDNKIKLIQSRAEELSKKINLNSIDAIITEPYLGPLLKGNEPKERIKKIIEELENLYLNSFKDWKKILKKGARIVIIFPIFKNINSHTISNREEKLNIYQEIKNIGYKKINSEDLIYTRPGQKVIRSIEIFERN